MRSALPSLRGSTQGGLRLSANRFFIITGASGSGKSTLIEELRFLGHSIVHEAGRAVVREQVARGGQALPWIDMPEFTSEVLTQCIRDYEAAAALQAPVFFDRAIPEARLHTPEGRMRYLAALRRYRYNKSVFVMKPWQEIFVNDAERRQDYDTSLKWYEYIVTNYVEAGYELCNIPKGTVRERAEFVLARVAETV
jgi:predicted ATPase